MKGEGRRAGSLLCSRKVLSGDCEGLVCAARPEARNRLAQNSASRASWWFIRRSYSRRRRVQPLGPPPVLGQSNNDLPRFLRQLPSSEIIRNGRSEERRVGKECRSR